MHVPIVPYDQLHDHAITGHRIMNKRKYVTIGLRELQYSVGLCGASAVTFPRHLAPLDLAAYLKGAITGSQLSLSTTASDMVWVCTRKSEVCFSSMHGYLLFH